MGDGRRASVVGLVVAAALAAGGCSTSQAAFTAEDGGYAAGDGSVVLLAEAERGDPVELAGTTLQGEQVDVADWRGAPVVLNTWFAACGPCREEAPELAAVAQAAPEGVRFLGINVQDSAAQGIAFEEQFGVSYPSLMDRDGEGLLALRGTLNPTATPTTLVLDDEGRVAARVSGPVEEATLRGLVDEVSTAD